MALIDVKSDPVTLTIEIRDGGSCVSTLLGPGIADLRGAPPSREHAFAMALSEELQQCGGKVLQRVRERLVDVPEGEWAPSILDPV